MLVSINFADYVTYAYNYRIISNYCLGIDFFLANLQPGNYTRPAFIS